MILPSVYANQTMQSAMRRQRHMRKARTGVVISGGGSGRACRASIDQVILLFLASSFRDALYLSLEGSVRMLLLLS